MSLVQLAAVVRQPPTNHRLYSQAVPSWLYGRSALSLVRLRPNQRMLRIALFVQFPHPQPICAGRIAQPSLQPSELGEQRLRFTVKSDRYVVPIEPVTSQRSRLTI